MQSELNIGPHRVVQRDGVVLMEPHGHVDGAEARAMLDAFDAWCPQHRPFYLMVDGSGLETFAPDARKAFVHWGKNRTAPEYVATIGLGFTLSTLVYLMQNAARLVGRAPEVKNFDQASAARAWLASNGAPAAG